MTHNYKTYLQGHTDYIESFFNLRMFSSMSQLFTQPDAQAAQSHTSDRAGTGAASYETRTQRFFFFRKKNIIWHHLMFV